MITDCLCLFLGLCFTSVCPLPVIFLFGVNCQSFFPSVNKGGNYTLFLGLSVTGEVPQCSASTVALLAGFSQLCFQFKRRTCYFYFFTGKLKQCGQMKIMKHVFTCNVQEDKELKYETIFGENLQITKIFTFNNDNNKTWSLLSNSSKSQVGTGQV